MLCDRINFFRNNEKVKRGDLLILYSSANSALPLVIVLISRVIGKNCYFFWNSDDFAKLMCFQRTSFTNWNPDFFVIRK